MGPNRLGSNTDLALYALYEQIQIVIVNARTILRDSTEATLRQAVMLAGSGDYGAHDELGCRKSKFVCAILSENHYQLGVVRSPQIRAVFDEGKDWENALRLILEYVRSRAPVRLGERFLPLSVAWKDPHSVNNEGREHQPTTLYKKGASAPQNLKIKKDRAPRVVAGGKIKN